MGRNLLDEFDVDGELHGRNGHAAKQTVTHLKESGDEKKRIKTNPELLVSVPKIEIYTYNRLFISERLSRS